MTLTPVCWSSRLGGSKLLRSRVWPFPPVPDYHPEGTCDSRLAPVVLLDLSRRFPLCGERTMGGMRNFSLSEFWSAARTHVGLFLSNAHSYRSHARRELPNLSARRLVARAAELVEGLNWGRHWEWSPPGVRAQLVDIERRELVIHTHVPFR